MILSFWLILLAVLAYGWLHTLLASLEVKAAARRWFGTRADQWFRLAYNFIAIITLLPVLLIPILFVDQEIYVIRFPWVLITLAIQLLAVIIGWMDLRQTGLRSFIGLRQLMLPEVLTPPRLVTNGLYHYVRHPLYTAGLVFIWLIPYMTCHLLALNIGLTVYIIIGAHFEERKLLLEFGEPYAEYRRRTPMLIPGLRLSHPKPQEKVSP